MAFITAPDFKIKEIDWTVDDPSQDNISQWTGTRVTITDPWHTKHTATVTLATQQSEATFRLTRSWLYQTKGTINIFRIYATTEVQNANTGVTVSATGAAGATTLSIAGYSTPLLEGQFFTINGQLCCCTADQSGSLLTFLPRLRQQATVGATVVTSRPYALVHLVNPKRSWNVASWRRFGISFDVEEAIMETDGSAPESTPFGSTLREDGSFLLREDGSHILLEA